MNKTVDKPKLPYAISEYVTERFREDFLFEFKERKQVDGQWHYTVQVAKDEFVHTLVFDERGVLLKEVSEPAFPADPHEGPVPEDIPE